MRKSRTFANKIKSISTNLEKIRAKFASTQFKN